jgi:acetolactate synthase I/II/III large subunit
MPTGGELVVKVLQENQIDFAFGIPAVHNLPIYDALLDSKVRSVSVKHEQAAGFMAMGSAYSSGKLAPCIVGAGPGATNILTPVGEAFLDSFPLLVVAGGIRTVSGGKGALHDIDLLSMFKPVTKLSSRLADPKLLEQDLSRALKITRSGRPRPVFVEIPFDVLSGQAELKEFSTPEIPKYPPNANALNSVLKILRESRKPAIIAGGGVNSAEAWNELAALAESLQAIVASTISAKGAFPETSPLSVGQLWNEMAQKAILQADVVLSLGCRFSERSTTNWRLRFNGSLIQVDIDEQELGRNYPASLSIKSDLKLFINELLGAQLRRNNLTDDSWLVSLNHEKAIKEKEYEKYDSLSGNPIRPQTIVREIQRSIPDDTLIVAETGYAFWWSAQMLKVDKPRSYLGPSGDSTLGFGFPAAMGAKCAQPDRPVVCLVGDGGFMFSCQEIATAVEEEIPFVTMVFDDGGYAAIREYQRNGFGGRFIGVNFKNQPDFVEMAESLGAEGILVTKEEEISSAIRDSIRKSKCVVIDVKIGRDEVVLPSFFTQVYRKS